MYEIWLHQHPAVQYQHLCFADDDQKAQMLKLAQAAADSFNAAGGETLSPIRSVPCLPHCRPAGHLRRAGRHNFRRQLQRPDRAADRERCRLGLYAGRCCRRSARSLSYGEAAAVQNNGSTLILMVRVDPLSVSSLDDLRSQILSDMKGGELDDALALGGAELAHDLDSSAMNKLPAKRS